MKRVWCVLMLAGLLLCGGSVAGAEVVGEKLAQSDNFRKFVGSAPDIEREIRSLKDATQRNAAQTARIKEAQTTKTLQLPFAMQGISFVSQFFQSGLLVSCAIIFLGSLLYALYLFCWNPGKLRMMTSPKTLGLFIQKIKIHNRIAPCLALAALATAATVAVSATMAALPPRLEAAPTNVLQDMTLHFSSNETQRNYVRSKYATDPLSLSYATVNGVPVMQRQVSLFDRNYNILAHQLGMNMTVVAADVLTLDKLAHSPEECQHFYTLLRFLPQPAMQEAMTKVANDLGEWPGSRFAAGVERMQLLLNALPDPGQAAFKKTLLHNFLAKSMPRVKSLDELDTLAYFAKANSMFEAIKPQTQQALASVTGRLGFADTVHAARIALLFDPEQARNTFLPIRYNFKDFLRNDGLVEQVMGLIKDLAAVPDAPALYDAESVRKSMQALSTTERMALVAAFAKASPELAGMAYDAIPCTPSDIVFNRPATLTEYATLTKQAKPDNAPVFLDALKRALVEHAVDYTKKDIDGVLEILQQNPAVFYGQVLHYDKSLEAKYNKNNTLLLECIAALPAESLPDFAAYFVMKRSFHQKLLELFYTKSKPAFYALLQSLYETSPADLARLSFPNDVLDFSRVAPAFSAQALAHFKSLRAPFLLAHNETTKPSPDIKLLRKALIPILDDLFKAYLSRSPNILDEEEMLTALAVLTIIDKPTISALASETAVLNNLVDAYFKQDKGAAAGNLAKQLEQAKTELAQSEKALQQAQAKSSGVSALDVCLVGLGLYILLTMALSALYACNAILPGRNFSYLHWLLQYTECQAKFGVASILFAPFSLPALAGVQFVRGLVDRNATTPDLQTCVDVLTHGLPEPTTQPAAGH